MPIVMVALKILLVVATGAALFVLATNWPSRLDQRVAMRYLRSRRSSRLLSLITVIAVGGVRIGVMALVIFFFVVTATPEIYTLSLHDALPHLRVLTYG